MFKSLMGPTVQTSEMFKSLMGPTVQTSEMLKSLMGRELRHLGDCQNTAFNCKELLQLTVQLIQM
jgi:hypothetical protein